MPPPVKEPITFLGWIEDLFKVPFELPQKSFMVFRDNFTGGLQITVSATGVDASKRSELISAFVESPEAFKDLSGVNTKFKIEDIIKQPLETLDKLGKGTVADVFKLDDIASIGRSETIESLTRGDTTIGSRNLNNPTNNILQGLKKVKLLNFDGIIDPIRGSAIRLVVNTAPSGAPLKLEDRRTAEEGERGGSQYKTYTSLSGSLTGITSALEDPKTALRYRDSALDAYNRSVMRELGIDLDKTLPTTSARRVWDATKNKFERGGADGTFKSTFLAAPGANSIKKLEAITTNNNLLAQALGKPITEVNAMTSDIRALHVSFLESEFRNQGLATGLGETKAQMAQAKTEAALQFQLKIDAYRTSIKANILSRKPAMIAAEVAKRNAAMLAGTGQGPMRLVGGMLIPMPIPWTPAELALDGTELRIDRELDRALERLRSATKSMDVAHNLVFASTTRNLLESIEKGSFLKAFFISTRFAGTLPFISNGIWDGTNNPIIQQLEKGTKWLDNKGLSPEKLGIAAGLYAGIAFEVEDRSKLKGISKLTAMESQVSVEWETTIPSAPGVRNTVWHQTTVKAGQGAGLYGEFGVYDTVNELYTKSNGQLLKDINFPVTEFSTPEALFSDPQNVRNFFDNLELEATNLQAGIGPGSSTADAYQKLATHLGLDTPESLAQFKAQYAQYTSANGGEKLIFNTLSQSADGIPDAERWAFLARIDRTGKAAQFTTKYMGALNWYNRNANAAQNFLYKQIIFGKYGGNSALIKGLIKASTPLRKILQTVGMQDDVLLGQAVAKWGIVRKATVLGNLLKSPKTASTATNAASIRAIGKIGGKFLASTVSSLARSAAGKALLQSAGYLLSGLGGALTGGIGWVVAAFGDVIWKFGKNALKLNFRRAWAEAKEALQAKWEVVKKVIIYPLACCCGCIVAPIGLIIIVIASQLANFNPFGGGSQADIDSKMLSVKKEAVRSGTNVQYTITITNISENDAVDIESISDTLNFTFPCPDQGGSGATVTYQNNTPEYTWNVTDFPADITGTVTKAAPMVLTYTVNGDKTKGTYFNFIEVKAKNEPNRTATASIGTDMQDGPGCVTCPSGWPFTNLGTRNYAVTQGPGGSWSHETSEAADIAPYNYTYNVNSGQQVSATHRGTVWFSTPNASGGYGNLAIVRSPKGFSTYYAHLDRFNPGLTNGQLVDVNTVLGILGTTGNSTGFHLHYEFRNPGDAASYQCLSGHELKLIKIGNTPSYVPKNIPRVCVEVAGCGNTIIP